MVVKFTILVPYTVQPICKDYEERLLHILKWNTYESTVDTKEISPFTTHVCIEPFFDGLLFRFNKMRFHWITPLLMPFESKLIDCMRVFKDQWKFHISVSNYWLSCSLRRLTVARMINQFGLKRHQKKCCLMGFKAIYDDF